MKQYRVEVQVDDNGNWIGNNRQFTTIEKATTYALDLRMRWSDVKQWRIVDAKGLSYDGGYMDNKWMPFTAVLLLGVAFFTIGWVIGLCVISVLRLPLL